jgi:ribose-phosphate pyrophosphokinase
MTTLAILPPPLRRLFSLLDFAPRPKSEDLRRLLEYWRVKRCQKILPPRDEIDEVEIGGASSRMFLYEAGDTPRDYKLAAGRAVVRSLLGDLEIGNTLSQAKNRRVAARLRRLFDCVREAGEPVLAEFVTREGHRQILAEVLAAPVGEGKRGRAAIFGGVAIRPLHGEYHAALHRLRGERESLALFALGDSSSLGESVAHHLGLPLAPHEERDFEDGEHKARPLASVRGSDVYVLSNLAGDSRQSANDRLCRLLFFIGALKDAGAARVTAVVPYLCYSRKDRQTKPRDPVTTRYVAQLFEAMATDHVITLEAHNLAAFQNAFRCDTDHLDANLLFADHFAAIVGDDRVAVASPDVGGVKRAERFREQLDATLGRQVEKAFMDKQRSMGKVTGDIFAGDVSGRTVIVLDDLISTGTTMARMAAACRERGAASVHLAATHGLFSGGAPAIFDEPSIASVVVTDSISPLRLDRERVGSRLVVLSIARLLAQAISRSHSGGSIVELLERGL